MKYSIITFLYRQPFLPSLKNMRYKIEIRDNKIFVWDRRKNIILTYFVNDTDYLKKIIKQITDGTYIDFKFISWSIYSIFIFVLFIFIRKKHKGQLKNIKVHSKSLYRLLRQEKYFWIKSFPQRDQYRCFKKIWKLFCH